MCKHFFTKQVRIKSLKRPVDERTFLQARIVSREVVKLKVELE